MGQTQLRRYFDGAQTELGLLPLEAAVTTAVISGTPATTQPVAGTANVIATAIVTGTPATTQPVAGTANVIATAIVTGTPATTQPIAGVGNILPDAEPPPVTSGGRSRARHRRPELGDMPVRRPRPTPQTRPSPEPAIAAPDRYARLVEALVVIDVI